MEVIKTLGNTVPTPAHPVTVDELPQPCTGQHARANLTRGNKGQQQLVECYLAIKDLLPKSSHGVWRSWVRAGRRVVNKLSHLKDLNSYGDII